MRIIFFFIVVILSFYAGFVYYDLSGQAAEEFYGILRKMIAGKAG